MHTHTYVCTETYVCTHTPTSAAPHLAQAPPPSHPVLTLPHPWGPAQACPAAPETTVTPQVDPFLHPGCLWHALPDRGWLLASRGEPWTSRAPCLPPSIVSWLKLPTGPQGPHCVPRAPVPPLQAVDPLTSCGISFNQCRSLTQRERYGCSLWTGAYRQHFGQRRKGFGDLVG